MVMMVMMMMMIVMIITIIEIFLGCESVENDPAGNMSQRVLPK